MFCGIADGTQPASIVADAGEVLAFTDVQPAHSGHLLVVPREHATNLAELPAATGRAMFALAHRLAAALGRTDLPCDGINLFLADGAAAGQEVWHVHLHVLPRITGDGLIRITAEWQIRPRPELDEVARKLRAELMA